MLALFCYANMNLSCSKTQIALEYAYRRQDKTSCSVFWVYADTEARFNQGYNDIAKIAGLPLDLTGEDLLRAVKQWIELQTIWLLVLDNADNLKIFKKPHFNSKGHQSQNPELLRFVPRSPSGTVIWTSRDGSILGSLVSVERGLEVGAMTDQESWELFQKLSGRLDLKEPSESEDKLLELLERLPLAIAQAAAYIRKTKVSVQQYLIFFKESEDRQSKLLSEEFGDIYRSNVPNSVMQTWLISMRQIAKESPCGQKILNTIAFFDNQGLPFELLKAAAGPTFNEDEVLLAAGRLIDYSFLQVQRIVDEGLPDYQQHRLVNLATRRALTKIQSRSFSGDALRIMSNLFPDGSYETWSSCRLYLPHALKAAAWLEAEGYNDRAPLLLGFMGLYYWQQGRSDEAEQVEVQVLELRKSVLGDKHPDTITAMANLAGTWQQQGRSDEAEQLKVEVLELRKSVLGDNHPDTIMAMANLAGTWQQQGRSDEAERLQVEVLELQKSVLGNKHPDTIMAMANLAATWQKQGRSDEAERLQVEVLELRKSVLGDKHPDTIMAMANLAGTWWQQGRSDEAERLQVEVLELRKNVLGDKHPDTIRAMANLSIIHQQSGYNDQETQARVKPSSSSSVLDPNEHETPPNTSRHRLKTWKRKIMPWKKFVNP